MNKSEKKKKFFVLSFWSVFLFGNVGCGWGLGWGGGWGIGFISGK